MEEGMINQYSYMKSIRFNLIDDENKNLLKKVNEIKLEKKDVNFDYFFKEFDILINNFKYSFFETDKENNFKKDKLGNYVFKKTITIKKSWFKIYFKDGWDFKRNKEKYSSQTQRKINDVLYNFNDLFEKFKIDFELNRDKKHKKNRNSHFSYLLQKIKIKDIFYFLKDLVNQSSDKNEVIKFVILNGNFDNFEQILNNLSKEYLSSQSLGVEVIRSSFNSYTLNKNSKQYLEEIDKKIKGFENEKNEKNILELKNNSLIIRKFKGFKEFVLENLTQKDLEVIEILKKELNLKFPLSLEECKSFMKLFKANLKSDLFKDCQVKKEKTKNLKEIKNYSCLFDSDDNLERIFDITREIQRENNENSKNVYEIQKLKKNRGNILNSFSNWKYFIDRYKVFSQSLGRINANIENYKKEKIDCKKLNYWNLILKNKDKMFLLFVPKEKWRAFEEKLKSYRSNNTKLKIYRIKSLTKRALHKLCFNEVGSFYQEHSEEFQKSIQRIKKLDSAQKEKETLKVLKNTLKSDYTEKRLDLKDFDLENSDIYESKTLDEFEENLEKRCYKVLSYDVDKIFLDQIECAFGAFKCKISSYDLNERFLDKNETSFESSEKKHTKDYWNEFWSNLENSKVRLNPEVRVNFKEKDFNLRQYLANKNVTDDIIKKSHYCYNRNLENKFIVQFSFLKNSGEKFSDLGFADFEECKNHIKNFNKTINDNLKDNAFYCGIDIGEAELASLAVFKFENNKFYPYNNKGYLSPSLPDSLNIKCVKLKEDYLTRFERPSRKKLNYEVIQKKFGEIKEKQIISNISYFDDRKDFFERISPFGLDLTCAKVVNGKIIENADVLTYLQYLKKLAKRRLFDIKANEKFPNFNDFYLDWEGEKNSNFKTNTLVLKCNGEKIKNKKGEDSSYANIFTFIYKYEGIETKKHRYDFVFMKDYFNEYLEDLKKIKEINNDNNIHRTIQVPMINHLRDALVSNIIGVLAFLKEKFGNCYIVLENEENKNDDDKYIIKRLELALYQKFQTLGLVPPQIKDLMKFRKDVYGENKKQFIQIGNIIFVDSSKTSKLCPYCEVEENNPDFHHGKNGLFYCSESCGFKTNNEKSRTLLDYKLKEFEVLKSNDIVASYNIAKKGFKFINNIK